MNNDYGNLERHKVLLCAMKDIDKICRDNNLKYFMYAGTILGAVKHGGFIPWDDDADIVMFKNDYDKFVKIIEQKFSNIYFMQTFDSDPEHFSKMSKLRIIGTENIEFNGNKSKHNEIFIDVSPIYNVPDNKFIRLIQRKLIEGINLILGVKSGTIVCGSLATKLTLLPLSQLPKKFWGNIQSFIMENMGNFDSEYMGIMCNTLSKNPYTGVSGYENDMTLRKSHVNEVYIPFEDTEFMTISDWNFDLIRRYGPKYMDPYPEEKRITKHNIKSYYISDEVKCRIEECYD